ncbi:DUF2834 domain-containing protein [Acaryochloris sp. IP29b_bin.148]|uniref:DUF2834 domain-containing protein n=1 Tax=Acaryochloris sp. IP29b_bin.148 TaxID=2969218 RepID=UPI00263178CD|nr:DUF2834 domain-containing protein [Acaryochloris sp. IP29b_bin.148]
MVQKIGFGLLWLGFSVYAFVFAPADQVNSLDLIQKLATMHWQGINPLIIALFNLMGIWPMIYGSVLFADGCEQKIPAWPFASLSFAFGAFALLPYLVLRQSPQPDLAGECNRTLKFWDSRGLGIGLLVGAIALLTFGLSQGDWIDFTQLWQTSRFIHVMSLDFCMLSLVFPALLIADAHRRGVSTQTPLFWSAALMPLLGPLIYLCLRPSLYGGASPTST